MKPNVMKAMLGGLLRHWRDDYDDVFCGPHDAGPAHGYCRHAGRPDGKQLGPGNAGAFHKWGGGLSLMYVFLLYPLLPGAPWLKGMLWGVILWLLAQVVVIPMMGGGLFSMQAGGMMAAMSSLMSHILYGAALGGITGAAEAPTSAVGR